MTLKKLMKFNIEYFNRWRKSLQTRVTLAVLVTAAILIEATAVVQYIYARNGIRDEAQHRAEAELRAKDLEIAKVMLAVEAAANSTVWMLEKSIANPDEVAAVMQKMMNCNPNIEGCGVGFVADYYPSKGRWYEPYVSRGQNGTVMVRQIGGERHDYLHAEWFANPFSTNKKYWSEPYYDNAGGKTLMVTYAIPVHDATGRVVAVFGTDISLDWLDSVINANRIYPSSYNLIISRTGQLMACPVESLVMRKNLQEITAGMKDTTVRGVNRRMMTGHSGQATIIDDAGEKNYVFYAPIKSDSTLSESERLGWSMAIVCSDREIYSGLRQVGFNLMLLMFFGMGLLTYIMFRAIRSASQLQKVNAAKQRIDNELAVAQRIQLAMLPKAFAGRDDLDIAASLIPAREVGGDLYDYCMRDEKLFFCIGDVSGKGVPAAIVMAMAQSAFRMLTERESSPERIVSQMNNALANDNDYSIFITLLVGVLDIPTGRLRFCNAGHKAPIYIYKGGDEILSLDVTSGQLPIGAMPDWKYTAQETVLAPYSTVFLYTDGVAEAENGAHEQFGKERMIGNIKTINPTDIVRQMTDAVNVFTGDAAQSDDITMLAICYMHQHTTARIRKALTLPNDVATIPQMSAFVENVCEEAGFNAADVMQINLAMEEAVVNVMNYAYPEGKTGEVNITAEVSDTRLKFIIEDYGSPFDPTTREDIDTSLGLNERSIGGLGIHLMRCYMDSINYERNENKNILTLRKKIKDKNDEDDI